MRATVIASLASLASLASPALAQPPGLVVPTTDGNEQPEPPRLKSETVATIATLAGIAIPSLITYEAYKDDSDDASLDAMGLMMSIVGGAAGQWYSNHIGTVGIAARLVGVPLAAVGLSEMENVKYCASGAHDGEYWCQGVHADDGRTKLGIGLGIVAASWVYDLVVARREVRTYNARRTTLFAPMVAPNTAGVSIAGAF